MKVFCGIDIGSTKTKMLVLGENGSILRRESFITPKKEIYGFTYFDIASLDHIVDDCIALAETMGDLVSVGFDSVGESVVPVKNRRAIFDAPFWSVPEITSSEKEREVIAKYDQYAVLGVSPNRVMSLDKILWYMRNGGQKPDFFLPICSYEVYRKTGKAMWDYTQGSRSCAFDVFHRKWVQPMLDSFGIDDLGPLDVMGSFVAEKNGVVYALGGQDHYVGMYGLSMILGEKEFIYDSMGTSSSVVLSSMRSDLSGDVTYNIRGGGIINGFEKGRYLVFRGIPKYGATLASCLASYEREYSPDLDLEIEDSLLNVKPAYLLRVGGNFFYKNDVKWGQYERFDLHDVSSVAEDVLNVYGYNAMKTSQIIENLLQFAKSDDVPCYAGGGATANSFFMRFKATIQNRIIHTVKESEVCALGAGVLGIHASSNDAILPLFRDALVGTDGYNPDSRLEPLANAFRESYGTIDF